MTPIFKRALSAVGLIAAAGVFTTAIAQDGAENSGPAAVEAEAPVSPMQTRMANFERTDGLFPLYRDPRTGKVFMEITVDQLDQEFIVLSYAENGAPEIGAFRGAYRDQRIVRISREFQRLEFVEVNTAFYFDENNALSRAADANISNSIVASLPIAALTPETGPFPETFLIDADPLFKTEALHQVKTPPFPGQRQNWFSAARQNPAKTKIEMLRGYPENIDVLVEYVYDGPFPFGASEAITDPRSVSIFIQHSFVEMPDAGYEPRFDDYRVGYFFDRVTDLTSPDAAPYRDVINRWRLEKKDPDAALSDPVKPITWWIENTTPVEYRDTIADAVLAWNEAFEKAGFSNAMEVKVQPDDAEWDAGDVRYNVLRWTSSPTPPFGGYGPSFSNPRTGEIIASDIMLEYVFLTNRQLTAEVMVDPGAAVPFASNPADPFCSFGSQLQASLQFGLAAAEASGIGADERDRLVREGLYYLILHEVGHTLGLSHNMKASVLWGPKEVHDPTVTQGQVTASVMDYPAVNLAPLGMENGDFYHWRVGPYDMWAVEFGYTPEMTEEERAAILARSSEPGNVFGNDADDMRAPGRGIDPQVMINDLSSDPVAYGVDRIELIKETQRNLVSTYGGEDSWQELVTAYNLTVGQHATMATVMSRQIGGVYVDRTAPGQQEDINPYTPVPLERQKAAMDAMAKYVFGPEAFAIPEDLVARLQRQRRGFDFFGGTEDPKVHELALNVQRGVMAHLLNPTVLRRMTNSTLYGGEYTPADMFLDLNDAVFGNDLTRGANTFRQNLQIEYVTALVGGLDNRAYDSISRAAMLLALQDVERRLGFWPDLLMSADDRAHREQISRIMSATG